MTDRKVDRWRYFGFRNRRAAEMVLLLRALSALPENLRPVLTTCGNLN